MNLAEFHFDRRDGNDYVPEYVYNYTGFKRWPRKTDIRLKSEPFEMKKL